MSTIPLGNLVRMVPLELSDLPPHTDIPQNAQAESSPPSESRLLTFLLAILDEATTFLSPSTLSTTFTRLSTKPSSPSTSPVELYKREIPSSEISSVDWSAEQNVPRKKPAEIGGENWFARRSLHRNESSRTSEGTASWPEFVFGLKELHSKHEQDFTPALYDARPVLDWNYEIRKVREDTGGLRGETSIQDECRDRYSDITMEIYEMCHALPSPLSPRCFPVLVITAYTTPTSFLAVTVPVNLASPPLEAAYYSTGRNTTDPSATAQQQKRPVLGVYAAVETVRLLTGKEEEEGQQHTGTNAKQNGTIEWTMATTSDTRGNLPIFLQKPNLPGAVAKDVGLFTNWIRTVDVDKE